GPRRGCPPRPRRREAGLDHPSPRRPRRERARRPVGPRTCGPVDPRRARAAAPEAGPARRHARQARLRRPLLTRERQRRERRRRRRDARYAATGIIARSMAASMSLVRDRKTGTGTITSLRTRYPSRHSTTATSTVSLYL